MKYPWLSEKWNYILELVTDPCDAPFQIYAESFLDALLDCLIFYYAFDPVQFFTGWVRPRQALKGARGASHKRGNDKKRKRGGRGSAAGRAFGFDPSDWAGRNAPGGEDLSKRQIPGGAKYAWTFYDGIQRAQYWFMIYDLFEDGFYRWAAGVAMSEYCQSQRMSWLFAVSPSQGQFPVIGDTACVMNEIVKIRNMDHVAGNLARTGTKTSTATLSCNGTSHWPSGVLDGWVELVIKSSAGGEAVQRINQGGGGGMVSMSAQSPANFQFYTRGPYRCTIDDCEFIVFGKPDEPEIIRRGWKNLADNLPINWADPDA